MQLQNFVAQTATGTILPGATCSLLLEGTDTLASGLQDKDGAPLSNPFTADSKGNCQLAAPNGEYDLRITFTGGLDTRMRVHFYDANDLETRLRDAVNPLNGAKIVGFADPVAPAYLKTTSDILNAERVSVMRFIPTNLHSAIYDHTSVADVTANLNEAINAFDSGGCLTLPPGLFNITGISMTNADNLMIDGSGWSTVIQNNNVSGGHALTLATPLTTQQNKGITLSNFSLLGNALSGRGLQVDRGGWFDTPPLEASVISLDRLRIQGHGSDGIQLGKDSTFGAGNATKILRSLIRDNGRTGIVVIGQSNKVSIFANAIVSNAVDGIEMNQVASTNSIDQNFIADNTRFGVFSFRCEQPLITNNGFNRNLQGAVALSGDPTGSIKYTESALIMGNLFGDNGGAATEARELQIYSSKGTNVLANYFYGTGQDVMIYLNDYAEGVFISGNHYKDLTTEIKLKVKAAAINTRYTFDDNVDPGANRNIESNQATQFIVPAINNTLQTRAAISDATPRWMLRGDGRMEWASGALPTDVSIERINAGALRVNANVEMNRAELAENSAVPTNKAGYGRIYIEGAGATGAVKIRFSDGTTKTFTLV